jgi:hypothetical protein
MRRDRRLYRKGDAGFPGWLAFTAIILLMLIIAGFLVLKMMSKG